MRAVRCGHVQASSDLLCCRAGHCNDCNDAVQGFLRSIPEGEYGREMLVQRSLAENCVGQPF